MLIVNRVKIPIVSGVKGVSNPKRKQTPDERKAKDQEYEAKR